MYYFSIDTITKAYSELQDKIPSKFVGLLSIFKNINSNNLQANMTYKISSAQIGNCLNDIMYLKDEDNIVSNSFLYVRFSLEWDDYVEENMFANKVNIYPFLVFLYKFVPFEEQPSVEVLIQKFASEYHISILSILKWFYKGDFNVVFASECVKRTELKEKLKIQYSTLTFDSSYSVKAKASELSRAPFIQTLYAGMDSVKCLLISKINLDALYPALNVLNKNIKEDCFPRQQIFYGAPGTGKSFTINQEIKGEDVIRTTFHPDSDYSSFVGAYKPTTQEITMRDLSGHPVVEHGQTLTEEKIVYEFVPQAFLQAYIAAWEKYAACDEGNPQRQFLVIEEINRGNCAQIFGDLFQLLDRNHSGFSDYPVKADTDMKRYVAKALKGLSIPQAGAINSLYGGRDVVSEVLESNILLLPSNLFIWATMNTSDQSLFPIDSAFKRRWDWSYMPISDAKKGYVIDVAGSQYDWWQFLEAVNEKIASVTDSEDKKLGYYFVKPADGHTITAKTFVGKVLFYLWNDVFKDYGFSDDEFQTKEGKEIRYPMFYETAVVGQEVNEGLIAQFLNKLLPKPEETDEATNTTTQEEA
jgi:hypothetical protein